MLPRLLLLGTGVVLGACGPQETVLVDDPADFEAESDQAAVAAAPPCSAAKIAELLEAATSAKPGVALNCQAVLDGPSHIITKRVYFSGPKANGALLDCAGSRIGTGGAGLVHITSVQDGSGNWTRPEGVTVRNCTISGRVLITGMNASAELAASHLAGFARYSQSVSPKDVRLDRLHITTLTDSALYIAAGTYVTLSGSTLDGESQQAAIYLNHETGWHRIFNNSIHVHRSGDGREQIAVDGSANNWIANNDFAEINNGGIYIYRNCGETAPGMPSGTVRHQLPMRNQIINNFFYYNKYQGSNPAVWVGSRAGARSYCGDDAGYPFGSSASDLDYAVHNVIAQNQFTVRHPEEMIRVSASPNASFTLVTANELVPGRIARQPGCVVDAGTSLSFVPRGATAEGQTCAGKTIYAAPRSLPLKRYFLNNVGHTEGTSAAAPTYNSTPYVFEGTLGYVLNLPYSKGSWAPVYLCVNRSDATDRYPARGPECELSGAPLALLGYTPVSLPAGAPAVAPVNRCYLSRETDHFLTRDTVQCEGSGASENTRFGKVFKGELVFPW